MKNEASLKVDKAYEKTQAVMKLLKDNIIKVIEPEYPDTVMTDVVRVKDIKMVLMEYFYGQESIKEEN